MSRRAKRSAPATSEDADSSSRRQSKRSALATASDQAPIAYEIGDEVEAEDKSGGVYKAKVIKTRELPAENGTAVFEYFVHYIGWSKKHDTWRKASQIKRLISRNPQKDQVKKSAEKKKLAEKSTDRLFDDLPEVRLQDSIETDDGFTVKRGVKVMFPGDGWKAGEVTDVDSQQLTAFVEVCAASESDDLDFTPYPGYGITVSVSILQPWVQAT
eukprot:tig00000388_g24799.t1